ncbi:MAG TPA: hypothetical protein VNS46_08750 [Nocardioides sp.]|nr:hypothetical protein [Nocardioides sp.]
MWPRVVQLVLATGATWVLVSHGMGADQSGDDAAPGCPTPSYSAEEQAELERMIRRSEAGSDDAVVFVTTECG